MKTLEFDNFIIHPNDIIKIKKNKSCIKTTITWLSHETIISNKGIINSTLTSILKNCKLVNENNKLPEISPFGFNTLYYASHYDTLIYGNLPHESLLYFFKDYGNNYIGVAINKLKYSKFDTIQINLKDLNHFLFDTRDCTGKFLINIFGHNLYMKFGDEKPILNENFCPITNCSLKNFICKDNQCSDIKFPSQLFFSNYHPDLKLIIIKEHSVVIYSISSIIAQNADSFLVSGKVCNINITTSELSKIKEFAKKIKYDKNKKITLYKESW